MIGRRPLLSGMLAVFVLVLLFVGGKGEQPLLAQSPSTELGIESPDVVDVAESFVLLVHSSNSRPADDIQTATLWIDAGYGPTLLETSVENGLATFTVPGVTTAGVVRLDIRLGDQRITETLEVLPGKAVDPIAFYLGPRTIVADGEDASMVVAVPVDRFGNPTVNGTTVDFSITRPGQLVEAGSSDTSGLLAFFRLQAGTEAGRTRVAATVGDVGGPERSVLEVAGLATPFELLFEGPVPPADGATLIEVRTDVLEDRFGNQLPDGVAISLDLTSDDGTLHRRVWSTTIGGQASFTIEVPDSPQSLTLLANTGGGESLPLRLVFPPAVGEFPVSVVETEDGWMVTVGRVIGSQGAYLPDGTIAEARIDGVLFEIALENGLGSVVVENPIGSLSVSVLGIESTDITGFSS